MEINQSAFNSQLALIVSFFLTFTSYQLLYMLRKYFISNVFIMLLLNLLVKPLWIFFIDRKVQLTVGHEEYGLYGALVGLTVIFNIVLDMGITSYNNKSLAADNTLIEQKLPNMIVAKLLLSLAYFVVILLVSFLLNYGPRALFLVILLAVVQMLNSLLLFLRSNVSANHHFKTDSLLSVLDKLIMIALCAVLLYSPSFLLKFKLEWFIYAQIVAYFIAVLVAIVVVVKRYSSIQFSHLSIQEIIFVCKKSIPFAILILLMAIYMRSDTLLLERMEGAHQNSLYLEAYRILDAVNMIAFLFAGILLPMFSRILSQRLSVANLVSTTANIMLSASLAFVAFCLVYAHTIMNILYHDVDATLVHTFCFVIASFPAFCIMYIYCTLLTANGNIALLIKIALFGSIFSLLLNAILIHYFHALGAAITCSVVEWLLGVIFILFSIQKVGLLVQPKRIMQFALVFVIMFAVNSLLYYLQVNIIYAIFINIIVFLILVYSIKLWDKQVIKTYWKQYTGTDS